MSRIASLLLASASLAVSGCATLGGNVKGDFACRAPEGTCRPMTAIDAAAVGQLGAGAEPAGPAADAPAPAKSTTLTGRAVRTGERVLTIVLPAHVDAAGVLHDAATVHAVVEAPAWAVASSGGQVPDPEFSRSSAPSSLREAIAGASAPAIEGLELPAQAPQPFQSQATPAAKTRAGEPSAAAIAAARAGHRIGRPATLQDTTGKTVQPQSTGLPRGKVVLLRGDAAAAGTKLRALAAPALAKPGAVPNGVGRSADGDLGDPFGAVDKREQPR